jgi:hypothetical protein
MFGGVEYGLGRCHKDFYGSAYKNPGMIEDGPPQDHVKTKRQSEMGDGANFSAPLRSAPKNMLLRSEPRIAHHCSAPIRSAEPTNPLRSDPRTAP